MWPGQFSCVIHQYALELYLVFSRLSLLLLLLLMCSIPLSLCRECVELFLVVLVVFVVVLDLQFGLK